MEILAPRTVPLGGLRAMSVRRALPQRQRTLIGAWCFVDHYGPDDVAESGGMVVPPHPHTGLSTVSWLFSGEVEHRDSAGYRALVRPGEVNLMTAGRGIAHSEYSTTGTTVLHGAQLWLALPDAARHTAPTFEHYAPELIDGPGWQGRVFLGSAWGSSSPVRTHTRVLGVELQLAADAEVRLPIRADDEHGVLLDGGDLQVAGASVQPGEIAFLPRGTGQLHLHARTPSRLLLLGGEPLGERLVMWWNFIGRNDAEIREYRADWQELVEGRRSERFDYPAGDSQLPLPAPAIPATTLLPRG